tara:strand:+ start:3178 stop:3891 length:714 start_codon:yes stop_codon:yes gene_type:complete
MKKSIVIVIIVAATNAHEPDKDDLEWTQYYRLGSVQAWDKDWGYSVYSRLKRTTVSTFRDLRFFGHFFGNDEEIRLRQKSSRNFLSLDRVYSFNTLIYEKNTELDINLRYHYNYGLGYFLQKNKIGNKTLELGVAFENSDYLNTEQKTAYLRAGCSLDHKIYNLSTKFEIDYFHQMSSIDLNLSPPLSRFQALVEIGWPINNYVDVISGMTIDIHEYRASPSFFTTASFKKNISWSF